MASQIRGIRLQSDIQKEKNLVADALSRIEINNNENESDNEDSDLLSILPQVDTTDELSPEEADLILNSEDPLRLDEDTQTQHTAVENPVFGMPISEKPLNSFVHRLEIKLADEYKLIYKRPFKKHHYLAHIRRGQEQENLRTFLKEVIDPKTLYGIYFQDESLERIFSKICGDLFTNTLKIIKTTTLCKDLEKQMNKIISFKITTIRTIMELQKLTITSKPNTTGPI
ncbi:hypothetical protein HHI36_018470 [Cryptolaemus montrouzieri]|uniref:Uncharacterized protein n=1 Tax=Cryptolaemus montrouzieri TaxID=559131 RepID=A0ABD2P071_9CUCU